MHRPITRAFYKKKTLQLLRVCVSQFLLVIMQFSKEKDTEKESVP